MPNDFSPLNAAYPVEVGYQINNRSRVILTFDAKDKAGAREFEDRLIALTHDMRLNPINKDTSTG